MYPKKRQTAVDDLPTDNDGNPIYPEPTGHQRTTKNNWEHHLDKAAQHDRSDEAPDSFQHFTSEAMDVAREEHGPGSKKK